MYVYTENYGDVVRWKYYPENDIEEIEDDYETYTFIDELLQDVRKNIKDIYDGSLYQVCRKAPRFSTGDIRHVRRICSR